MPLKLQLPRSAWTRAFKNTLLQIALCIPLSVLACFLLLSAFSDGLDRAALAAALLMPLLLGVPILLVLNASHQSLQLAYERLERDAACDSLTGCLNHGAFAAQVGARLDQAGADAACGALLVIDADHFKTVNDRFGHDQGDAVLKFIAATIRNTVRATDLVGRIGGEEFGVFLPGANRATAEVIAERIRSAVSAPAFRIRGEVHPLSVSVGGAVFERAIGFSELFRSADQRMYKAKNSGRNNVDLVALDAPEPETALARAG